MKQVEDQLGQTLKRMQETTNETLESIGVLENLAQQEELTYKQMIQAESVLRKLTDAYGDFGIKIDETTSKLKVSGDALTKATGAVLKKQVEDALGMLEDLVSKRGKVLGGLTTGEETFTLPTVGQAIFGFSPKIKTAYDEQITAAQEAYNESLAAYEDFLGEQERLTEQGRRKIVDAARGIAEDIGGAIVDAYKKQQRERQAAVLGGMFIGTWASGALGKGKIKPGKEMEDHARATEKAKRVLEQFLTPQERFVKLQKELGEYVAMNIITQEEMNRTLARARKERQITPIGEIQGVAAGSLEAKARIESARMQAREDKEEGLGDKLNTIIAIGQFIMSALPTGGAGLKK
jgi:hypothetical protein